MTKFVYTLLIALISGLTFAQPVKNWGTTGIFLTEEREPINAMETTFVPDSFNGFANEEAPQFLEATTTSPGLAMLASGIVPGSGQAMNGKWGRAAVYFVAEAVSIAYYINQNNLAEEREREYESYGNDHWSVLAYAQWLVDYSEANGIVNGYEELAAQLPNDIPNWGNTTVDWGKVDLNTLRKVERRTPFYFSNGNAGSDFSHVVQDWGSQQYYELMSKYYQFVPGWEDFYNDWQDDGINHVYQYSWSADMGTDLFYEGRDRAAEFNQNYRNAGNILTLMMVNHIVSAFDAYFTVKLKNSRIQAQANTMSYTNTVSVSWHF